MFKITTKTTKEQLKSFLGANAKAVKAKDKDLFDQIAYADKMAKTDDSKVTRKDLVDLVKSVISLLGDKVIEPALAQEAPLAPVEPVAENSVKKLAKGVSKKQKSMEEEPATEESGETETAEVEEKVDAKKSAKKSLGKKSEKKSKDGVTALEGSENQKTVQMAKMFPETLEVGDVKYELAHDIKTIEDLHKALASDEEIVFAYYWTARHLRQFPYYSGLLPAPKKFDNDLDLATCIYVSDDNVVSYQISMYTEAMYMVLPTDFAEEDGLRISRGVEYQIYRAV